MRVRRSTHLTSRGRAVVGILIGLVLLGVPAAVLAAEPGDGFIEICKAASGPGVTGSFDFQVDGRTVAVPVGACSPAIELPAGTATVTEVAQPGAVVTDVSTTPSARLISHSAGSRMATVAVAEGSVSTQTVVTFTNSYEVGQLKLCKIAGPGIATGANFVFMVGPQAVNVPAGPTPGGFCSVAGSFPAGTDLSITETPVLGATTSSIVVDPADRVSGTANVAGGQVNVTIGAGATEVTFTNRATASVAPTTTTTTTPSPAPTTTTTPPAPTTTTPATIPQAVTTTTTPAPTASTPTTTPRAPTTTTLPPTTTTRPPIGSTATTTPVPVVGVASVSPTTTTPCVEVSPTTTGVSPATTVPSSATTSTTLSTTTSTTMASTTMACGGLSPTGKGPTDTTPGETPSAGPSPVAAQTHLAHTGMRAGWWVQWALGLLVLGGLLVAIGDTRSRPARIAGPPARGGGGARRPDAGRRRPPSPAPVDDLELALADPPFLRPLSP